MVIVLLRVLLSVVERSASVSVCGIKIVKYLYINYIHGIVPSTLLIQSAVQKVL